MARDPRARGDARPKTALLLGVYGGEHIGDAAILGGVLLRLARRRGVTRAVVASFRPVRSRRLFSCIEAPVPLDVVAWTPWAMARLLPRVGLVVWAGGPIGDYPGLLARHLAVGLAARACGVPFHVEGAGIGALSRTRSRWLARALLRSASSIAVRSAAAAAQVVRLAGRTAAVAPDPAFDYIAAHRRLDRVTPAERASIDAYASRPAGMRLVCVNVRRSSNPRRRHAAAAAFERLAAALAAFASQCPVRYVLFALETDARHGDDVAAARALARQLPPGVDIRVWPEPPTVDGVLTLLRAADAAVTMRLHASIFALSQDVPTIGIDFYDSAGPGKITELFTDLGLAGRVIPLSAVEPSRLVHLLVELTGARTGAAAQSRLEEHGR